MKACRLLIAAGLALAACGRREPPDPAGLSPEDSALLNNAAEELDVGNGGVVADPAANAG